MTGIGSSPLLRLKVASLAKDACSQYGSGKPEPSSGKALSSKDGEGREKFDTCIQRIPLRPIGLIGMTNATRAAFV